MRQGRGEDFKPGNTILAPLKEMERRNEHHRLHTEGGGGGGRTREGRGFVVEGSETPPMR